MFSLGEGDGSIIGVNPGEYQYNTWGFCNLVVNLGMRNMTKNEFICNILDFLVKYFTDHLECLNLNSEA